MPLKGMRIAYTILLHFNIKINQHIPAHEVSVAITPLTRDRKVSSSNAHL